MKTKQFFFAALAATALASCSSDDYIAEAPPVNADDGLSPIVFSSLGRGMTRADFEGAEAAGKLGKKFVVFGYKGSTTAWADATSSVVFDNYLVEYGENTANTTESNTNNWEYVGKGVIKHATDNGITKQTIKYWDYSKPQYDFIAWSTGSKTPIYTDATLNDGEVRISAIKAQAATSPATGLADAYTFEGQAKDLVDCYIADLVTVKKDDYNKPVTLKFRSLGSKVRIGIYETVPGYSVKNVQFYTAANTALEDDTKDKAHLFTTTANDIYTQGKYTIYFPTVDNTESADNNQAHIKFAGTGTQSTVVNFNGLQYTIAESGEKTTGASFLGRTSNTASFAGEAEGNYYTAYLPNEAGTNLNLRVNYTLEAIDGSGEIIEVKGATAQVPSIYTQWKAGYAYTYLFKISDKTNGYTGAYDPTQPDNVTVNSDPAGLYPITFDACVVNAEDGDKTQETITTISTPSITTYQKGSNVVNNNEYEAATGNIYITVNDGTTGNTPDLANGKLVTMQNSGNGQIALYEVTAGTTEAFVIDALQIRDDDLSASGNVVGRNGLELVKTESRSDKIELTDKVEYGVDGNVITLASGQAAKFTPQANKTYAFVYFKTIKNAANDVDKYQPLAFANFATGATKYRYAYKAATAGDAQKGVLYYSKPGDDYTQVTPFVGQGVSNLYLDNAGNKIASGLAVTGTTYYYTTDGGQSYKAAHNVAYADFGTTLYVKSGDNYEATTDTTPQEGTAYYYKESDDSYTYCVILPQQTTDWYEIDTNTYVKATETTAVTGMTYFDKYTQNDGVYYAKVIKVQ